MINSSFEAIGLNGTFITGLATMIQIDAEQNVAHIMSGSLFYFSRFIVLECETLILLKLCI